MISDIKFYGMVGAVAFVILTALFYMLLYAIDLDVEMWKHAPFLRVALGVVLLLIFVEYRRRTPNRA